MDPNDAQTSLDDIRRMQDHTRDEIVRHNFARPYIFAAALGLFVGLASSALDRPWSIVAFVLGFGLYAVAGIVHEHRASVRSKPSGAVVLFQAGVVAVLMVIYSAGRIAAWGLFSLPPSGYLSQGTVGAVLAALVYLATTPLNRKAVAAIMRRNGRRG